MILNFAILSLLLTIEGLLAKECHLDDQHMDKSWVFTYNKDILRTDVISDKTSLQLICGSKRNSLNLKCKSGILDEIPKKATCPQRFRATVVEMKKKCRANKMTGTRYDVRYIWSKGKTTSLYDVCYNHAQEMVLFARHKAYGFDLPVSDYKRPQFATDRIVSRERANSFNATSIYETFNELLGTGQKYVDSPLDFAIQRGHLANSQDFLSYDQMDETFKYINVQAQFRGVNNGNWKAIETWIHKLPKTNTFAEVITGGYGVLELPHSKRPYRPVPMYLMASAKKNPIPMWTYKVVKYNNRCYAFVTLNNEHNKNAKMTTPICRKTNCPSGLNLSSDLSKGLTHCCTCAHLIREVAPIM